jgi:hypothetical protein
MNPHAEYTEWRSCNQIIFSNSFSIFAEHGSKRKGASRGGRRGTRCSEAATEKEDGHHAKAAVER